MAARSAALNGLEEKIEIVEGDITKASAIFSHDSFDVITSNPPYMVHDHGFRNSNDAKAIARHEILCRFRDISGAARVLLKHSGSLFLVHRSYRLSEILNCLSLQGKRIQYFFAGSSKRREVQDEGRTAFDHL